MDLMEFNIPENVEDLYRSGNGRGRYNVAGRVSVDDLSGKIEECQTSFAVDGPPAIISCFHVFVSVISNFGSISQSIREHYWDITIEALANACTIASDDEDNTDRSTQRSVIKMFVYLISQFVDKFESLTANSSTAAAAAPKKSRKTKKMSGSGHLWDEQREKLLVTLMHFLEQDLVQFWDPPTPEMLEDVTGLVIGICYKFLESPVISRDKELLQPIASLLGLIVKRYHQNLTVSIKMIQLIQNYEHVVSPICHCISIMVQEYQLNQFVCDVTKEISETDPKNLSIDASGAKNFANFITELSQALPADLTPSIEQLMVHLKGESYTMRIGILSAMGEMISHVLVGPYIIGKERDLRNLLLEKLLKHCHDTNAFVRSKVCHIWQQLCQSNAIPLSTVKKALELIIGRTHDKSSQVRKSALQAVNAFISGNPFASNLDLETFQSQVIMEEDKLRAMLPPGMEGSVEQTLPEGEERSQQDEREEQEEENGANHTGEEQEQGNSTGQDADVLKQIAVVHYYRDAVIFIEEVSQCIPFVTQLLRSKVASDKMEAIGLLATACQFGIRGAHEGIRASLVNVWSSEQAVRGLLTDAYIKLYLNSEGDSPHLTAVKNLFSLLDGATVGELVSLEEMIILLMRRNSLSKGVLNTLWDIFTDKVNTGFEPFSTAKVMSMILIAMVAKEDPVFARHRISQILDYGLVNHDLKLSHWSCIALQRCTNKTQSAINRRILAKLRQLLIDTFPTHNSMSWSPLAEQTVAAVYLLAESPDLIMESILKDISLVLFGTDAKRTEDGQKGVDGMCLSRFVFLLGEVAKKQLIHLEVNVCKELKNRRLERNKTTSKVCSSNDGNGEGDGEGEGKDSEEAQITGGGATDEDLEHDMILRICDEELGGSGLLGSFLPLVVSIVTKPSTYPSSQLQTSASLTLAKYMLLSPKICDKYLRILFTLLENSDVPAIRANTIIALGDLAVRYPNIVEPWTPHLYSRLRDPVYNVRLNTMIVLSRLILYDMIKVKGQISELALCLEDTEQQISDRAKSFFSEFSRKTNALYNVLPDIISNLIDPDSSNISSDAFRNIMKYLLSFIEKERQTDGLIDKICQRFRVSRTEQQSRDLAFCLSLLNCSERGMKKLLENLPCYQGLLSDDVLYSLFVQILSKAKKNAKVDFKIVLEEFEAKLSEIHEKGLEGDEEAMKENISSSPPQAIQKSAAASTVNTTVIGRSLRDSSIMNSALSTARSSQRINERRDYPVTKKRARKRGKKKTVVSLPLSESDED